MATGNEFLKPPAEELTDKPAPVRKVARAAALAAAPRKSVLVINDNNSIHSGDSQSVPIFMSALKALGYDVKFENSNETSYTTWKRYDIVVWSCSDDYSAVNANKARQMLVEYVGKGGHLILESGNIAAWIKEEGETILDRRFRENVLYATTDWIYHDVGDLNLRTNHPIATTPNLLPETIIFTPTDPGDDSGNANAVRILPDATGIYNWSSVAYGSKLVKDSIARDSYGLIAYESKEKNGGRIVYFAFDIDDIDSPDIQRKLIQNSVNWLAGGIKMSGVGMHMRLCNQPKVSERVLPKDIHPTREHLLRVLGKKWVNGTELRYCFLDQPSEFAGKDEQKNVVREGFKVWKKLGIGVKFEEVSNADNAQVRIGFLRDGQTWSLIGRDILDAGPNERTMNFGWDLIREDDRGADTPTHEIGHTLGFPHEHQNPNAGIMWNEDAVYDWASRTQGWDKETTDRNIISKIIPDEVEGSSWDPDSIMHYAFMAGLINEPEKYRNGLTPAGGLSERDITWVRTFYPPLDPTTYNELTLNTPVPLSLGAGEQKDFIFVPQETRTYDIATSGESDTVMVLFEEKNGKRIQLAANDDGAEDFNSHISWGLTKGSKYVISIRLYYEWVKGDTTVKVS